MPTYRHNNRNEVLHLRALLKLAFNALRENKCLVPKEVLNWVRAQRDIPIAGRVPATLTVDKAAELVREGYYDEAE